MPFYSAVSGGLLDTAALDGGTGIATCARPCSSSGRHARCWTGGLRTFIEISPHPVLTVGLQETIDDALAGDRMAGDGDGAEEREPAGAGASDGGDAGDGGDVGELDRADVGVLGSLRRGEGGPRRFLTSLGEAWVRGRAGRVGGGVRGRPAPAVSAADLRLSAAALLAQDLGRGAWAI